MKEENIKLSRRLMALLVAGGISFAPIKGKAITNNSYDPGTFVKIAEEEDTPYGKYVVKKGDNVSRISEKVCSHLRIEITTKYWPAIAFLNSYPRVIEEGDIIIYPKNPLDLEKLNDELRKVGWTKRYIQKNKIYKKSPKKNVGLNSISALLYEIYGPNVCIDEDFIHLYLKIHDLDSSYILTENTGLDNDTIFELTDWIPTLEELMDYRYENKGKTKIKK